MTNLPKLLNAASIAGRLSYAGSMLLLFVLLFSVVVLLSIALLVFVISTVAKPKRAFSNIVTLVKRKLIGDVSQDILIEAMESNPIKEDGSISFVLDLNSNLKSDIGVTPAGNLPINASVKITNTSPIGSIEEILAKYNLKENGIQGYTQGKEITDIISLAKSGDAVKLILCGAPGIGKSCTSEDIASAYNLGSKTVIHYKIPVSSISGSNGFFHCFEILQYHLKILKKEMSKQLGKEISDKIVVLLTFEELDKINPMHRNEAINQLNTFVSNLESDDFPKTSIVLNGNDTKYFRPPTESDAIEYLSTKHSITPDGREIITRKKNTDGLYNKYDIQFAIKQLNHERQINMLTLSRFGNIVEFRNTPVLESTLENVLNGLKNREKHQFNLSNHHELKDRNKILDPKLDAAIHKVLKHKDKFIQFKISQLLENPHSMCTYSSPEHYKLLTTSEARDSLKSIESSENYHRKASEPRESDFPYKYAGFNTDFRTIKEDVLAFYEKTDQEIDKIQCKEYQPELDELHDDTKAYKLGTKFDTVIDIDDIPPHFLNY